MSKFIKCWVFIICLLFIFLIIFTDRVNAKEYQSVLFSNYTSTTNLTQSLNANNVRYTFNFDKGSMRTNAPYETLIFTIWGTYLNSTINGTIDMDLTCNNTDYTTQPYLATITYADGSQANILYSEYTEFCGNYHANNTTLQYPNESNDVNIQANIVGGNSGYTIALCKVENNYIICPIKELNYKVDSINIYVNRKTAIQHNYALGLSSSFTLTSEDNQSIINTINNQSTQQHQDNQSIIQGQQDINNSITSSDVTGNNSNTSITTIGNTFNTQGDFLLNLLTIPYNLWSSIINVLGDSCDPIDVGTIFGEHLIFPCINLNSLLGGVWTTIIDVIFTGMIYSAFIRRVIKYFRELLTLDPQALETGGVKIW